MSSRSFAHASQRRHIDFELRLGLVDRRRAPRPRHLAGRVDASTKTTPSKITGAA